jgi:hypothetical protein
MNKESDWMNHSSYQWTGVENTVVVWSTGKSVEKILSVKPYKNILHKNNWIHQITITKEYAENGNMILSVSIKLIEEGKKDKIFKFKIWLHPWWRVQEKNYDDSDENTIKYITWVQIRYIQKTDKNNGWARFATHNRLITWFGYFKYLNLDFSHEEFIYELKQALIHLDT